VIIDEDRIGIVANIMISKIDRIKPRSLIILLKKLQVIMKIYNRLISNKMIKE
jgi:hypothetical protein